MPISDDPPRARITAHLAELFRLQIVLARDMHDIKTLSDGGEGREEIRLAYETLEQYLAITDAFLENMRGRFEARLGVLRRAEPLLEGKPTQRDLAPGHTQFWLEFSRLTAVLRRIGRRAEL